MRVYLTQPPSAQRAVGKYCLGPNAVVTQEDVDNFAQKVTKELPLVGAVPTLGQRGAPLVNLATYFQAGGEPIAAKTVQLAGNDLVVTATAAYDWDFGDGTSMTTTTQGRGYAAGDDVRKPPSVTGAIMHWYRSTGPVSAALQTTWHATFTFNGGATVVVPVGVTPAAVTLPLTVHSSRSTLYN